MYCFDAKKSNGNTFHLTNKVYKDLLSTPFHEVILSEYIKCKKTVLVLSSANVLCKIRYKKGDLCKQPQHAIDNSANKFLNHGGGYQFSCWSFFQC